MTLIAALAKGHYCKKQDLTPQAYSHRNTFVDTTMHATNISASAATSPE